MCPIDVTDSSDPEAQPEMSAAKPRETTADAATERVPTRLCDGVDRAVEPLAPGPQLRVGLGKAQPPEAEPLSRLHLPQATDVERADSGDLRVAPGGLPVDQEHDRLAVANDLDSPEGHPVGDDVVAA